MSRLVVYALGGGQGHLTRALAFARRFHAGWPTTILHSAQAHEASSAHGARLLPVSSSSPPDAVRELLASCLRGHQASLVVDTFPAGILHELDPSTLGLAREASLLGRFVKPLSYADYTAKLAPYESILLPYDEALCEWGDDAQFADKPVRYLGNLARKLPVDTNRRAPLVVVGDPRALSTTQRRLLPARTHFIEGRFDSVPQAPAYVGLGAGYNLAHELCSLGRPFGLVPQDRRYDDQFRRSDLLGASELGQLLREAA